MLERLGSLGLMDEDVPVLMMVFLESGAKIDFKFVHGEKRERLKKFLENLGLSLKV
jgi:hypothetical protein